MPFRRSDQINSLFSRTIAEILPDFFSTKRYGMLTVTSVQVSKNFDSARVNISVLRNGHQFAEDTKHCIYKLQQALNSRVVMKKIPKLILELDKTSALLEKIENT